MTNVNLISPVRLQARKQRTRIKRWVAIGSIYTLVLVVGCGMYRVAWAMNTPGVGTSLVDIEAQTTSIQKAIDQIQAQLGEADFSLKANRELREHPDWSLLLRFMSNMLGEDLILSKCHIKMIAPGGTASAQAAADRSKVQAAGKQAVHLAVKGMSRSLEAVSQFALRLEQTGLFTQVKLVDTNLEPFLRGKVIVFRIECTLEPSVKADG